MATAVPSKRQVHPNGPPPGRGFLSWVWPMLESSVGTKFIVALTGLGLTGFVIAHLLGNLNIFIGRDALNEYAHHLQEFGPLLWVARIGLLTLFLLHLTLSLRLRYRSSLARPVRYAYADRVQSNVGARSMVVTGIVILAFVIFHIAHYTLGIITSAEMADGQYVNYLKLQDPKGLHDVYAMTVLGFRNPVVAALYIIAQLMLLLHLSHGVGSVFQTLGLNAPRTQPLVTGLSWGVALVVALGNIAIVVACFSGLIPLPLGLR